MADFRRKLLANTTISSSKTVAGGGLGVRILNVYILIRSLKNRAE